MIHQNSILYPVEKNCIQMKNLNEDLSGLVVVNEKKKLLEYI